MERRRGTSALEAGLHDATDFQIKRRRWWWRCHSAAAKLGRRRKHIDALVVCMNGEPGHRRDLFGARRANQGGGSTVSRLWTHGRWPGGPPRFVVLQLLELVTPHSPCQSCTVAAWCSRTRSAAGKPGTGESINDLLSEAKRHAANAHLLPLRGIPSTWTVWTLMPSASTLARSIGCRRGAGRARRRAQPKRQIRRRAQAREEQQDNVEVKKAVDCLRMTVSVRRRRECLLHKPSGVEQRGLSADGLGNRGRQHSWRRRLSHSASYAGQRVIRRTRCSLFSALQGKGSLCRAGTGEAEHAGRLPQRFIGQQLSRLRELQ